MIAPGRNSPCPCGSGKRYKDCHGALAAPSQGERDPRLVAALAAHQAGKLDAAAAGYEAVLVESPREFDALHMLGVVLYQRGEFERALDLLERALALQPGDQAAAKNRRLVIDGLERRPIEKELAHEAARCTRPALGAARVDRDDAPVRVLAFYLPQFHRIPENDAWWGEGFTEWTNVRRARPVFAGHCQPHEPGELGYYDLTDPAARAAQASLARAYGIDGFCYYYYWFGGKQLLERPLEAMLASATPDFPFCLCWANENWTRRWDGLDQEILIAQRYSPDDRRAFIRSLYPAFRDSRYIRVNGRPLVVIYKPSDIPDVATTVAQWRDTASNDGMGGIYLAAVQWHAQDDPTRFGFDAAIEFPPIGHSAESVASQVADLAPDFRGHVFSYRGLVAHYLSLPRPAFRQFRGVTPMWDNTARRPRHSMIVADSTPEVFRVWVEHVLRQTMLRRSGDERLVFVNAWNEWGEGNHLEPDARHGRRYLEALNDARSVEREPRPSRPSFATVERETAELAATGALRIERFGYTERTPGAGEHVSVVMPVYNHERYLARALESIATQTEPPMELVAIDDGSTDGSAELIAEFARRAPFRVTLARQANAGAHSAINRGIALASERTIALINSDDVYAPRRLALVAGALDEHTMLAFSDSDFIDEGDQPAVGTYASRLRERIDAAMGLPNLLYALIAHNVATSTGNLVFRRELLGRIGGFAPLAMCHDWDFVLAATYATRIAFVRERLYRYRLHGGNAFSDLTLAGRRETEVVLDGFFAKLGRHPWFTAQTRDAFIAHARALGFEGYLRSS